jgi:hypothetical protein
MRPASSHIAAAVVVPVAASRIAAAVRIVVENVGNRYV